MAHGDTVASFVYLQKLDLYRHEKPFQVFIPVEEGQRSTNLDFEFKEQNIVDIRPNISSYQLDTNGFEVRRLPTALTLESFESQETIKSKYLPEVEDALKSIPGDYDRIFFFDWRLRTSESGRHSATNEVVNINNLGRWLPPVRRVHVDQSPRAVVHRVQLQLGEDAPFLLGGRVRIINVWRPLGNPIQDWPLAVCDAQSMPQRDLVETDHVRRAFKGSTYYAYYNPDHRWHYLSNQTPDEVLFLKMFDSDPTVKAQRCAHAAFNHPNSPPDCPPRRSIEVRALVFNYPKGIQPPSSMNMSNTISTTPMSLES